MSKLKNHASGGRVVNVLTGKKNEKGEPLFEQYLLRPGEEADVEVLKDDPVVAGLVAKGDLSIDGRRGAGGADEARSVAREREDSEKRLLELARKEAELRRREDELVHREDAFQKERREAATKAGAERGLADPLPAGTEKKEASEEAKLGISTVQGKAGESRPVAPQPAPKK